MSKSTNEESRLDRLEIKVTKIVEHLQVLTNVMVSLTASSMASDRKLCNRNGKTIGEPSKTKPTSSDVTPARDRRFSKLGRPLSEVFKELKSQGLIIPLEPRPLPNPVPRYLNLNLFCYLHQQRGHDTDNCARLRHEIQDLIDSQKIPDPEREQPGTHRKSPPTRIINPSLPDSRVLQTHNYRTSRVGMQGNSGKSEIKQMEDFWENLSDSDEGELAEELLKLEKLLVEESEKTGEDEVANHGDVYFPDLIQL